MTRGNRTIDRGGARGNVFRAAARERLLDAEVLLRGERFGGAVYLAGYALECGLKWAITEMKGQTYLPERFEIHDLDVLLNASGLSTSMRRARHISALYSAVVDIWKTELRYVARKKDAKAAQGFYNDVRAIYDWIIEEVT